MRGCRVLYEEGGLIRGNVFSNPQSVGNRGVVGVGQFNGVFKAGEWSI